MGAPAVAEPGSWVLLFALFALQKNRCSKSWLALRYCQILTDSIIIGATNWYCRPPVDTLAMS